MSKAKWACIHCGHDNSTLVRYILSDLIELQRAVRDLLETKDIDKKQREKALANLAGIYENNELRSEIIRKHRERMNDIGN